MPKTKKQGLLFGLIMSFSMAYGMEVYNTAIRLNFHLTESTGFSSMTNLVFWEAFKEALLMVIFVFVISELYGNKVGMKFMQKHCNPQKDNPYLCQLFRQAGTVGIMCPSMSLVAAILFNCLLGGGSFLNLPAIWVGTMIKNFPMAFFWNMFFAAPFTHWVFGKIVH